MLGRNIEEERGKPIRPSPAHSMSEYETELMGQATRCVRKFAPEGRKKMRRTDNGHITACKISDANPNEMIASWSGDHIYSFDLVRSPDAREGKRRSGSTSASVKGKGKVRESSDRKRKRKKESSMTSLEAGGASPKPRRAKERPDEDSELALRVRYDNGQSEDIAMSHAVPALPPSIVEEARESVLNESQKHSLKIAKSLVKIRKLLFSLERFSPSDAVLPNLTHHIPSFAAALGIAATCTSEMDEISRSWRYPVNPSKEDVVLQRTLRSNRDSSRRFVQAAGTLARILGGETQGEGYIPSSTLDLFHDIVPGPHEGSIPPNRERFCYDFLRAIILWLGGGVQALLQGFKRPANQRKQSLRFPLPADAEHSTVDDILIPYLLNLAGANAIPNVDASRFERDETRKVFESETAAVNAFAHAIKMPIVEFSSADTPALRAQEGGPHERVQPLKTALKFWAFKVGRGILMNAGEGVDFQFVDTAFGGLGIAPVDEGRCQEDVDPSDEEDLVKKVSLVRRSSATLLAGQAASSAGGPVVGKSAGEGAPVSGAQSSSLHNTGSDIDIEDAASDAEVILMDDLHDEIAEHMAAEDEDEENNDNEVDDNDSDPDDGDDGDITAEERTFMFRSASARGKLRELVEKEIPCYPHTRQYRGHCNVKTVKDANFFGLQDEYVVSGSDGGHLFIWDKKTSELVNILEGDNEVVNVVQGKDPKLLLLSCLNAESQATRMSQS